MRTISVKDFTLWPGLRHSVTSEKSGEDYYHEELNPAFTAAMQSGDKLTVILDGTRGFPPSFLDEAFGNLVYDFSLERVTNTVVLVSDIEPHWISYIKKKCDEWEVRRKTEKPERKVTAGHQPWYRFVGDRLERKEWATPTL